MGLPVAGLRATIYPIPSSSCIPVSDRSSHSSSETVLDGALGWSIFFFSTVMRVCLDHIIPVSTDLLHKTLKPINAYHCLSHRDATHVRSCFDQDQILQSRYSPALASMMVRTCSGGPPSRSPYAREVSSGPLSPTLPSGGGGVPQDHQSHRKGVTIKTAIVIHTIYFTFPADHPRSRVAQACRRLLCERGGFVPWRAVPLFSSLLACLPSPNPSRPVTW